MLRVFATLFFLVGLVHCSSNSVKKSSDGQAPMAFGAWSQRMNDMGQDLDMLLPYVYSQQEFIDPANKSKIKEMITEFSQHVETVPQHIGETLMGKDPIVGFAVGRLRSNTHQALTAFADGHYDFSRSVLRENLGICFSCHTSTQLGPQKSGSNLVLKSSFRMSPNERAEYYVATRQFDKATDVLSGVVRTPSQTLNNPHDQVEALRLYLSLQVRVKKEPAEAASLLDQFLDNKGLPYFVATDAEAWQKSLREWIRERSTSDKNPLDAAKRILNKARQQQSSEGYQSAYVDYLRASAHLHEALRQASDKKNQAQIYYMLGDSYESLANTGTWELPEVYYEACIRTLPNTVGAQKCYKAYERSIVLGYSGSAGIFVPKEERERLKELKALAGFKSP